MNGSLFKDYMKQLYSNVQMLKISPLTEERIGRNNEEKMEKIRRCPNFILDLPLLYFGMTGIFLKRIDWENIYKVFMRYLGQDGTVS